MNKSISSWDREVISRQHFSELGPAFHLCTPENYQVIFTCKKDFMAAMNLLALAFALFPDLKVLAFQIMSNHLHILVAGNESVVKEAFALFKRFLKRYISAEGRPCSMEGFDCLTVPVSDLENCRNVIAYINRNGFVIDPDETPFSYPWGTSRHYFNYDAAARFQSEAKKCTLIFRQRMSRSRMCDKISGLFLLDGYVSPFSFCDIETGQRMFRDARNYFFKISKNVEGYKEIASQTGESIYYIDEDLYYVAQTVSKNEYGFESPNLLPANLKIVLAKKLHYEYNASNKQIQRILKLDTTVVNSLFPLSRHD